MPQVELDVVRELAVVAWCRAGRGRIISKRAGTAFVAGWGVRDSWRESNTPAAMRAVGAAAGGEETAQLRLERLDTLLAGPEQQAVDRERERLGCSAGGPTGSHWKGDLAAAGGETRPESARGGRRSRVSSEGGGSKRTRCCCLRDLPVLFLMLETQRERRFRVSALLLWNAITVEGSGQGGLVGVPVDPAVAPGAGLGPVAGGGVILAAVRLGEARQRGAHGAASSAQ